MFLSDIEEIPTVQIGDHILRLEVDEVRPEVKEIARKELRENPDIVRESIATLKDLLKG